MEFFRWVARLLDTQKVLGFPEPGMRFLDEHTLPESHPNYEFSAHLSELIKRLAPTPAEVAVRQSIVDKLCTRIREALGEGKANHVLVFPCGSCLTGTFLAGSDIDLVLFQYPSPCNAVEIMDILTQRLDDLATPGSFQPLPQAKVPVLKFTVDPGMSIDLTIDELIGPLVVGACRRWFNEFPVLLPAQLFLKLLLRKHNLDQPYFGGISSYTLEIMELAYLQYVGQPADISEFVAGSCDFYGNQFNFSLTGIDVRGEGSFFSRHMSGNLNVESPTTCYIIDPLNPRNILGHNAFKMNEIRDVLREAHRMMQEGRGDELLAQFDEVTAGFDVKRRLLEDYAMRIGLEYE